MVGFKLANTTFSTKIDEKLAAIDAYAQTTALVKNNETPDINDAVNLDGFNGLKGSIGDKLNIFAKGGDLGLKITPDALSKFLVSTNSGLQTALASLPNGLKSLITTGGQLSKITATINGITSIVKKADLSTLKGLSSVISAVSGANFPISFTDKSGLIALSGNIIQQASALGIPNVLKAFTDNINDKTILLGIAAKVLPLAVSTSDLNMLSNIASSKFAKDVLKIKPSFLNDFSKNFKLAANLKQSSFESSIYSLRSSFNKINPNWNKTTTSSGEVLIKADIIKTASPDFKTLLKADANSSHVFIPTDSLATLNTSTELSDMNKLSVTNDFFELDKALNAKSPNYTPIDASVGACTRRDFQYIYEDAFIT
jgi:hypothetical protein